MKISMTLITLSLLLIVLSGTVSSADEGKSIAPGYDIVTQGTRKLTRKDGSDFVKILVEAANLGGNEVEVAEITFAPNYQGSEHPHGSIEVFYVLSGELNHVVKGHGATLKPGMVGIVRPGDTVEHINKGDVPVKTLVIWVNGGEIQRSFGDAEMNPIAPLDIEAIGQ